MARLARPLALALCASTVVIVACVETLPHLVCELTDVQSVANNDCTSCLDTPCCDPIGNCDDACRARVRQAQGCLLAAGPIHAAREEPGCLEDAGVATDIAAVNAYRCMRDTCSAPCGLPGCRLDPAVKQILSASCDKCITGACCADINACYQDRTCKLQLECITNECALPLSILIQTAPTRPPGSGTSITDVQTFADKACRGEPVHPPAFDPNLACLFGCLTRYTDDASVSLDPSTGSLCLGARFFACGARSDCGPSCAADAGDSG